MSWLRAKARNLSLLALFALAVQFGLSFGHTHLHHVSAAQAAISQVSAPSSDKGHHADGGDVCAICATVALAQTLIDSTPPVLPAPANLHSAELLGTSAAALAAPQRAAFQSRGPPLS
jgi:hypothetical protein